ncbi:MAG: hypothetical protein IJT11_00305 [Bacteroidaceae bacterium]|nr:hypothetical protein [Bacteroidaceae bacterium]
MMKTKELIRNGWSKRMKFSFFHPFILSFFILSSCSHGLMTHEAVQKAAEEYYAMLIRGDYEGYVDGFADSEALPEDYKKEMVILMRQFMEEGVMANLRSVTAIRDSIAEDSTAYAILQLHFNDSTREQIELPLVLKEGKWRMQ